MTGATNEAVSADHNQGETTENYHHHNYHHYHSRIASPVGTSGKYNNPSRPNFNSLPQTLGESNPNERFIGENNHVNNGYQDSERPRARKSSEEGKCDSRSTSSCCSCECVRSEDQATAGPLGGAGGSGLSVTAASGADGCVCLSSPAPSSCPNCRPHLNSPATPQSSSTSQGSHNTGAEDRLGCEAVDPEGNGVLCDKEPKVQRVIKVDRGEIQVEVIGSELLVNSGSRDFSDSENGVSCSTEAKPTKKKKKFIIILKGLLSISKRSEKKKCVESESERLNCLNADVGKNLANRGEKSNATAAARCSITEGKKRDISCDARRQNHLYHPGKKTRPGRIEGHRNNSDLRDLTKNAGSEDRRLPSRRHIPRGNTLQCEEDCGGQSSDTSGSGKVVGADGHNCGRRRHLHNPNKSEIAPTHLGTQEQLTLLYHAALTRNTYVENGRWKTTCRGGAADEDPLPVLEAVHAPSTDVTPEDTSAQVYDDLRVAEDDNNHAEEEDLHSDAEEEEDHHGDAEEEEDHHHHYHSDAEEEEDHHGDVEEENQHRSDAAEDHRQVEAVSASSRHCEDCLASPDETGALRTTVEDCLDKRSLPDEELSEEELEPSLEGRKELQELPRKVTVEEADGEEDDDASLVPSSLNQTHTLCAPRCDDTSQRNGVSSVVTLPSSAQSLPVNEDIIECEEKEEDCLVNCAVNGGEGERLEQEQASRPHPVDFRPEPSVDEVETDVEEVDSVVDSDCDSVQSDSDSSSSSSDSSVDYDPPPPVDDSFYDLQFDPYFYQGSISLEDIPDDQPIDYPCPFDVNGDYISSQDRQFIPHFSYIDNWSYNPVTNPGDLYRSQSQPEDVSRRRYEDEPLDGDAPLHVFLSQPIPRQFSANFPLESGLLKPRKRGEFSSLCSFGGSQLYTITEEAEGDEPSDDFYCRRNYSESNLYFGDPEGFYNEPYYNSDLYYGDTDSETESTIHSELSDFRLSTETLEQDSSEVATEPDPEWSEGAPESDRENSSVCDSPFEETCFKNTGYFDDQFLEDSKSDDDPESFCEAFEQECVSPDPETEDSTLQDSEGSCQGEYPDEFFLFCSEAEITDMEVMDNMDMLPYNGSKDDFTYFKVEKKTSDSSSPIDQDFLLESYSCRVDNSYLNADNRRKTTALPYDSYWDQGINGADSRKGPSTHIYQNVPIHSRLSKSNPNLTSITDETDHRSPQPRPVYQNVPMPAKRYHVPGRDHARLGETISNAYAYDSNSNYSGYRSEQTQPKKTKLQSPYMNVPYNGQRDEVLNQNLHDSQMKSSNSLVGLDCLSSNGHDVTWYSEDQYSRKVESSRIRDQRVCQDLRFAELTQLSSSDTSLSHRNPCFVDRDTSTRTPAAFNAYASNTSLDHDTFSKTSKIYKWNGSSSVSDLTSLNRDLSPTRSGLSRASASATDLTRVGTGSDEDGDLTEEPLGQTSYAAWCARISDDQDDQDFMLPVDLRNSSSFVFTPHPKSGKRGMMEFYVNSLASDTDTDSESSSPSSATSSTDDDDDDNDDSGGRSYQVTAPGEVVLATIEEDVEEDSGAESSGHWLFSADNTDTESVIHVPAAITQHPLCSATTLEEGESTGSEETVVVEDEEGSRAVGSKEAAERSNPQEVSVTPGNADDETPATTTTTTTDYHYDSSASEDDHDTGGAERPAAGSCVRAAARRRRSGSSRGVGGGLPPAGRSGRRAMLSHTHAARIFEKHIDDVFDFESLESCESVSVGSEAGYPSRDPTSSPPPSVHQDTVVFNTSATCHPFTDTSTTVCCGSGDQPPTVDLLSTTIDVGEVHHESHECLTVSSGEGGSRQARTLSQQPGTTSLPHTSLHHSHHTDTTTTYHNTNSVPPPLNTTFTVSSGYQMEPGVCVEDVVPGLTSTLGGAGSTVDESDVTVSPAALGNVLVACTRTASSSCDDGCGAAGDDRRAVGQAGDDHGRLLAGTGHTRPHNVDLFGLPVRWTSAGDPEQPRFVPLQQFDDITHKSDTRSLTVSEPDDLWPEVGVGALADSRIETDTGPTEPQAVAPVKLLTEPHELEATSGPGASRDTGLAEPLAEDRGHHANDVMVEGVEGENEGGVCLGREGERVSASTLTFTAAAAGEANHHQPPTHNLLHGPARCHELSVTPHLHQHTCEAPAPGTGTRHDPADAMREELPQALQRGSTASDSLVTSSATCGQYPGSRPHHLTLPSEQPVDVCASRYGDPEHGVAGCRLHPSTNGLYHADLPSGDSDTDTDNTDGDYDEEDHFAAELSLRISGVEPGGRTHVKSFRSSDILHLIGIDGDGAGRGQAGGAPDDVSPLASQPGSSPEVPDSLRSSEGRSATRSVETLSEDSGLGDRDVRLTPSSPLASISEAGPRTAPPPAAPATARSRRQEVRQARIARALSCGDLRRYSDSDSEGEGGGMYGWPPRAGGGTVAPSAYTTDGARPPPRAFKSSYANYIQQQHRECDGYRDSRPLHPPPYPHRSHPLSGSDGSDEEVRSRYTGYRAPPASHLKPRRHRSFHEMPYVSHRQDPNGRSDSSASDAAQLWGDGSRAAVPQLGKRRPQPISVDLAEQFLTQEGLKSPIGKQTVKNGFGAVNAGRGDKSWRLQQQQQQQLEKQQHPPALPGTVGGAREAGRNLLPNQQPGTEVSSNGVVVGGVLPGAAGSRGEPRLPASALTPELMVHPPWPPARAPPHPLHQYSSTTAQLPNECQPVHTGQSSSSPTHDPPSTTDLCAGSDPSGQCLPGDTQTSAEAAARVILEMADGPVRVRTKTYGSHGEVEVYLAKEDGGPPPPHPSPVLTPTGGVADHRSGSRGVTFSPSVKEVNWRESYYEAEVDDDDTGCDVKKVLVVTAESPTPQRVDISPTPPRVDVSPTPPRVDVSPTPPRVDVSPTPPRVDVSPTPPRVDVSPTPQRVDVSPTPQRVDVSPTPKLVAESPAPPAPMPGNSAIIRPDIANGKASDQPTGSSSSDLEQNEDKIPKPSTPIWQRFKLPKISSPKSPRPKLPPKPQSLSSRSSDTESSKPSSPTMDSGSSTPSSPDSKPKKTPSSPRFFSWGSKREKKVRDPPRPLVSPPPPPRPQVRAGQVGETSGGQAGVKGEPDPSVSSTALSREDSVAQDYNSLVSANNVVNNVPSDSSVDVVDEVVKSVSQDCRVEPAVGKILVRSVETEKSLSADSDASQESSRSPAVSVTSGDDSSDTTQLYTPRSAVSKPPLPPHLQRPTQQVFHKARLLSARRQYFSQERQVSAPERSSPPKDTADTRDATRDAPVTSTVKAPLATAAATTTRYNSIFDASKSLKERFERFSASARAERERLAKSTPDLSVIEASVRRPGPRIDSWSQREQEQQQQQQQCESHPTSPASASDGDAARPAHAHQGHSNTHQKPRAAIHERYKNRAQRIHARARTQSVGVLETDLDTGASREFLTLRETNLDDLYRDLQQLLDTLPAVCAAPTPPEKVRAKSLLDLEASGAAMEAQLAAPARPPDTRAKSMEFLLDDDNKAAVQPPENELMKGSERQLSEAELRVRRSLQRLDVPEWMKNAQPQQQGFLLRRRDYGSSNTSATGGGWSAYSSKTASMTSLGSSRAHTPNTPTKVVIPTRVATRGMTGLGGVVSPASNSSISPSPSDRSGSLFQYPISRWSTSRLNSGTTTPTGSVTSSKSTITYTRQPYLGWRSQTSLASLAGSQSSLTNTGSYLTAADRLALGITSYSQRFVKQPVNTQDKENSSAEANAATPKSDSEEQNNEGNTNGNIKLQVPTDVADVHSSIKEVTSAIVHYCNESTPSPRASPRGSPRPDGRAPSPRRLVWVESSFVGSRPITSPETPTSSSHAITPTSQLNGHDMPESGEATSRPPQPPELASLVNSLSSACSSIRDSSRDSTAASTNDSTAVIVDSSIGDSSRADSRHSLSDSGQSTVDRSTLGSRHSTADTANSGLSSRNIDSLNSRSSVLSSRSSGGCSSRGSVGSSSRSSSSRAGSSRDDMQASPGSGEADELSGRPSTGVFEDDLTPSGAALSTHVVKPLLHSSGDLQAAPTLYQNTTVSGYQTNNKSDAFQNDAPTQERERRRHADGAFRDPSLDPTEGNFPSQCEERGPGDRFQTQYGGRGSYDDNYKRDDNFGGTFTSHQDRGEGGRPTSYDHLTDSTTLEDVLDSLLALPSASRSPSPVSSHHPLGRPFSHPGFSRENEEKDVALQTSHPSLDRGHRQGAEAPLDVLHYGYLRNHNLPTDFKNEGYRKSFSYSSSSGDNSFQQQQQQQHQQHQPRGATLTGRRLFHNPEDHPPPSEGSSSVSFFLGRDEGEILSEPPTTTTHTLSRARTTHAHSHVHLDLSGRTPTARRVDRLEVRGPEGTITAHHLTEANHSTGVLLQHSAAVVTNTPAHVHSPAPSHHHHAHIAYTAHSSPSQNGHTSLTHSPRVSPSHRTLPQTTLSHSILSHTSHPPPATSLHHILVTSAVTHHQSLSSTFTNCAHTEATCTAVVNSHTTQASHSCPRDLQVSRSSSNTSVSNTETSRGNVSDIAPALHHTPSSASVHHQPQTNVASHSVPNSHLGSGQVNQLGASPTYRAPPELAPACPSDPVTDALMFSGVIAAAPSIIDHRPPPGHRVTFHLPPRHMNIPPDSSSENGNGNENVRVDADEESGGTNLIVRCRNPGCGQVADTEEARRTYKTCHNCCTFYCSRGCRRQHWERHKRQCKKIRALAVAKQVTARVREDDGVLERVSTVARRGARALGRGTVKIYFPDTKAAETFAGGGDVPDAHYLTVENLLPQETGPDVYKQITELCKHYNTDYKFVLYISICIMNEIPTGSSPKWEREVVSQCAKMRLAGGARGADTWSPRPERHVITRDLDEPETLILTSAPIPDSNTSPQAARHIAFNNIVRHLRERGISLRHQYPDVYRKLRAYVEAGEVFPPLTIYPRDPSTHSTFMCIIMPETDHAKLQLLSNDASKVRTIDISRPHPPT
ncbi:uncharacterized protein [Panulirus ornatus]|uniref:uncharacterized protein isoform X3 n=1 Tax=Panulirus ornatus TaxID=150431 RepID=UPI003A889756